MTAPFSKRQILLARSVGFLVIALSMLGLLRYGLSPQLRQGFWQDLRARPGGPMTFRFILQPAMAAIVALRDGIHDAQTKRAPYFWALLTQPAERLGRLHEGLVATARIILLGLAMDAIYQAIVLKTFNPGQAVVVAIVLAFCPYLLLRGPFARLARRWRGIAPPNQKEPHHDR